MPLRMHRRDKAHRSLWEALAAGVLSFPARPACMSFGLTAAGVAAAGSGGRRIKSRRLSKDSEALPAREETWICLAMSFLMLARPAKRPVLDTL